ncbi:pyridoxamine 5'-phosphate oxidase family protein [Actinosynnema sp. NPDC053489]|uniref:pyridoxamine 5'-phosphate oxidase family protein n=1 Tax=Actinosynnema sp. NPDC053489 TaxID=3363916 RepID=UPI0037C54EA5
MTIDDVRLDAPGFDPGAVRSGVARALASTRLLSMATVGEDGLPWVNHAYFSVDGDFVLHLLTRPGSRHARNLAATGGRVAVAVADTAQPGAPTRLGLQLAGRCGRVPDDEPGPEAFRARFPAFAPHLDRAGGLAAAGLPVRLYRVVVEEFRLYDEAAFGGEVWVDGVVRRAVPVTDHR